MSVDVLDIAALVAGAIEGLGGAYFVGGSVASSVHGEPRATNDLDMVLRLPIGLAAPLAEALVASEFQVDSDQLRVALLRASSANIFYLPAFTKVDLFGVGAEAFDESEFARRQRIDVRSDLSLWVKSPRTASSENCSGITRGGGCRTASGGTSKESSASAVRSWIFSIYKSGLSGSAWRIC